MDLSGFLLLLFAFTVLGLMFQRTEAKRRLVVAVGIGLVGILVQRYANYREYHTEAIVALILAIVINGLFWVLIGRYNPVASSDDMKVLGMDD